MDEWETEYPTWDDDERCVKFVDEKLSNKPLYGRLKIHDVENDGESEYPIWVIDFVVDGVDCQVSLSDVNWRYCGNDGIEKQWCYYCEIYELIGQPELLRIPLSAWLKKNEAARLREIARLEAKLSKAAKDRQYVATHGEVW